jgi:replicative DNA helicase
MTAEPTPKRRPKPADRGLPHNWETERAVLGALLMAPERLADIRAILAPEDFHRPGHQVLYGLLVEMANRGDVPGVIATVDEIERRGCAETVGGIAYVIALPQANASIDLLDSEAKRVKDYATRRGIVLATRAAEEAVLDGVKATPEILDAAGAELARLASTAGAPEIPPLHVEVDEALDEIDRRAANPGAITGVPTGFVDLDRKLTGLQSTDFIVIAARPAMGKTAFVLNVATNAAREGYAVGLFSLEMSRRQLLHRALCSIGRVDAQRVRTGEIDAADRSSLHVAGQDLKRLPLLIDDTPGLSLVQLRARVRALDRKARQEHGRGLGLLIVDYLQLMQGTGAKGESRENVISAISRGMKILAKEMGIPVVALSQLNRSLESRQDKRPIMSDLRESGAIEQDADVILFIYRDEVYNGDASPKKGIAEIIVAKQRSGPIGTVELAFIDRYLLFQNLARHEDGAGQGAMW